MKSDPIVLRCVLGGNSRIINIHTSITFAYQRRRIRLPGVKEAMDEEINLLGVHRILLIRNDEHRRGYALLQNKLTLIESAKRFVKSKLNWIKVVIELITTWVLRHRVSCCFCWSCFSPSVYLFAAQISLSIYLPINNIYNEPPAVTVTVYENCHY